MGEARRKKQAGLMPVAEERLVTLYRDGRAEGDGLPEDVLERFRAWAETGGRWDARYRTAVIGAGVPQERLTTEQELRDIPVPERLRLRLHLLSGPDAWKARELELAPESFIGEGADQRQLSLRATEYDYGGQWLALPEFDPQATLRYLMQHPAVTDKPGGTAYTATYWHGGERGGQVDLDPAPDEGAREALEEAVRMMLEPPDDEQEQQEPGQQEQENVRLDRDAVWLDEHIQRLGDRWMSDDVAGGAPLARRVTLLLTPAPLVLSPTALALTRLRVGGEDWDVMSTGQSGDAYTLDGAAWLAYPDRLARRDTLKQLMAEQAANLSELLNVEPDPEETGAGPSPLERSHP